MTPTPVPLHLVLCDTVIIEERTRKVSLIGCFTTIRSRRFPAFVQPFSVVTVLTDAQGTSRMKLSVARLDTNEEVFSRELEADFPEKLSEVRVHFHLRQPVFPAPGWYQFTLLSDGQFVAQRRVRVQEVEDPHEQH